MSKKSNTGIVIIVLIIFVIAIYLIYTYGNNNKNQNVVNEVNSTAINNTTDNKVGQNEAQSNNSTNTETVNTVETENKKNENNQNTEVVTEDEREVAMSIAKDAWGDTDGVYFQMEETQKPNGDYIISVSADAKVLAWYYVNASARTYTVEYN